VESYAYLTGGVSVGRRALILFTFTRTWESGVNKANLPYVLERDESGQRAANNRRASMRSKNRYLCNVKAFQPRS
jgi:hypothetical protein